MIKILLLYPNLKRRKTPHLGLTMISAIAKNLGHQVELFDFITIPEDEEKSAFKSKINSFNPDILGITLCSNEWLFVKELFNSINFENIITIIGGPHATVFPEEVISIADVVVIGEGEETFSELLQKIEKKEDITQVAGCWVRQDGRIFKNEMRVLIDDLDTLPIPDWGIFNTIHYDGNYTKQHFKNATVVGVFEGSRGCPYSCTYCTNSYLRSLFKGKGRWRREKSPERLIKEMKLFKEKYGLDAVLFVDEILLTNIDRIRKFRDLFLSEIHVPFIFLERPENMKEEKVRLISEAGAIMVSIGIESGDEKLRKNVLNRHHSQEQTISAFHIAKKYGVATHAFTIIGLPEQDRTSMDMTYELLKKAKPDTVQTTIFYPLKRTKLFDMLVQRGELDPNIPMQRDFYETDDKELLKYQFHLTYYYLPRFIAKIFLFTRNKRFLQSLFNRFLALVRKYRKYKRMK